MSLRAQGIFQASQFAYRAFENQSLRNHLRAMRHQRIVTTQYLGFENQSNISLIWVINF
jgi:phage protein U